MKKVLAMLLCGAMLGTMLVGCGAKESAATTVEETSAGGVTEAAEETVAAAESAAGGDISGMTVGYCMPDTSESFLAGLSNGVKELFEADGVKVDIADAAGSSTTQIGQIENFAASGTDLIIIMAVDPTGVTDVIKRAQEAGSLVMVAGSDPGAYDAIMYTDQYEDGTMIAQMGADWIEKTFPDAAPGSIEIALFEDRSTPEATQRCEGMATITELTDKVTVAQVVGSIKNNDPAQAAMENVMQTNPDIKMVLCYNSSGAMGVNEYAMRAGSAIKDPSQFATFCSDLDEAALVDIADSAEDKAVLRGLIKFGSNDLTGDTYKLAKQMLAGEEFQVENPDPLTKITPENVAEFQ
ncbi:MAG: sugar ABC transporter substrate-binding protein [Lachnospiraceae bacterium]|nr:sugar ABC transporter substrate-binding protein [Lachnospiraceae bacterium]